MAAAEFGIDVQAKEGINLSTGGANVNWKMEELFLKAAGIWRII
jgi:uncharacterized protein (DUF2345 family)